MSAVGVDFLGSIIISTCFLPSLYACPVIANITNDIVAVIPPQ